MWNLEELSEVVTLGEWVDQGVKFVIDNDGGSIEHTGVIVDWMTEVLEIGLSATPWWIFAIVTAAIGFWRLGWKFAVFCFTSCALIFLMGFWPQTMITLALIFASTIISLVLGLPLGIWMAKSNRVASLIRPVLDYLVGDVVRASPHQTASLTILLRLRRHRPHPLIVPVDVIVVR